MRGDTDTVGKIRSLPTVLGEPADELRKAPVVAIAAHYFVNHVLRPMSRFVRVLVVHLAVIRD